MAANSKNKSTQEVLCIKVSGAGKSIWYAIPINNIPSVNIKRQSASNTDKIRPTTLHESCSTKDHHEGSGFCSIGSIIYAIGGVDLQDGVEQLDVNNPEQGWVCSSFGKMYRSRPDRPCPIVVSSKIFVFGGLVDGEIPERENWSEILDDFRGTEKGLEKKVEERKGMPPIPLKPLSDYERAYLPREQREYHVPKNDDNLLIAPLKVDKDSSIFDHFDIVVSNKTSVYVRPWKRPNKPWGEGEGKEEGEGEVEGKDGEMKGFKGGAVTLIYKCGTKECYRLEDLSDPPPDGFNMNSYKNHLPGHGVVGDHGTTIYWYDVRGSNRVRAYDYVKNIWYGRTKIKGLEVKVDDLWNPLLIYIGDDVFCLVGLLDGCLLVHCFKVTKKIIRPLPELEISEPIWSRVYQLEGHGALLMAAVLADGVSKSFPATYV